MVVHGNMYHVKYRVMVLVSIQIVLKPLLLKREIVVMLRVNACHMIGVTKTETIGDDFINRDLRNNQSETCDCNISLHICVNLWPNFMLPVDFLYI